MRYFILLAMCFQAVPAALANPIYRWVDDQGVPNYTNDPSKIPAKAKAEVTSGDEIAVIASSRAPSPPALPPTMAVQPGAVSTDILTPDERAAADQWRAAFREAHARIAWLEFEVKTDKQLLDDAGMPITRVSSHRSNNPWSFQPGYLQVQLRLHRNLMELKQARADLEELERAASREAVPREWRQP